MVILAAQVAVAETMVAYQVQAVLDHKDNPAVLERQQHNMVEAAAADIPLLVVTDQLLLEEPAVLVILGQLLVIHTLVAVVVA
jgi:hypothetical protein